MSNSKAVPRPDGKFGQWHESARWTSTAEELPPEDVPCLVAWDGSNGFKTPRLNHTACAIGWDGDECLWYEVDFGDDCEWDSDELPTHWMPLPPAPQKRSGVATQDESNEPTKGSAQ